MNSKVYLDEKVRQAHYQDLLREAEKERLLAQLPRHRRSISRHAAGKLGVLLLKLGAWLKQFEQSPTVHEDHDEPNCRDIEPEQERGFPRLRAQSIEVKSPSG
jgi:hypothetical protein